MLNTEVARAGRILPGFESLSLTFFKSLGRIFAQDYPENYSHSAKGQKLLRFPRPHELVPDSQLPDPDKITVSRKFVAGHFLEEVILKPQQFSLEDIQGLLEHKSLDLDIEWFVNGIVPASRNRDSTYFSHTWLRDAVYVALCFGLTGETEVAQKIMPKLALLYGSKGMREWLLKFTDDTPASPMLYHAHNDIPWVRFILDPHTGEPIPTYTHPDGTVEQAKDWAHAQLDAHGLFGWAAARLAHIGIIDLRKIDADVLEKNKREYEGIDPSRYKESIFALNLRFLDKVNCFGTQDHGPWENQRAHKRASSIGMCLGAFYETQRLWRESGSTPPFTIQAPSHYRGSPTLYFENLLEASVLEGTGALLHRIPNDPEGYAAECDEPGKEADASLAFLLYPLELPLTVNQKGSIYRTLDTLRREVAHIRYKNDNFNGKEYHSSGLPYEAANIDLPDYEEGEWPLIDAFLSAGCLRDYEDSNGTDPRLYELGERYARRALAAITTNESRYHHAFSGKDIYVGRGVCPELWTKIEGAYQPGKNSPLLWYEAAVALMLGRAQRAIILRDIRETFPYQKQKFPVTA